MLIYTKKIITGSIILLSQPVVRCALGAASQTMKMERTPKGAVAVGNTEDAYLLLASAISDRVLHLQDEENAHSKEAADADYVSKVARSLRTMSNAQGALKSLDGAAHEAYQRTTHGTASLSEADSKVTGRTARSAARAGVVADALFACELCELIEYPELNSPDHGQTSNGTLWEKVVLLNTTVAMETDGFNTDFGTSEMPELSLIVLYDPNYNGGAGVSHGGVDNLISGDETTNPRGRILVLLSDNYSNNLEATLRYLDLSPFSLLLRAGRVAHQNVSLHENLWKTAGRVLEKLAPSLLSHGAIETNSTAPPVALHFLGRSLSGGVAGLAAAILDGLLPMPNKNHLEQRRHTLRGEEQYREERSRAPGDEEATYDSDSLNPETQATIPREDISGFGRGRTSAMLLGPPPCLSSNVQAAFATSIIYGDDVVPRSTFASLNRLCRRVKRHVKGGVFGKRLGLVTDAVSLTMTGLKRHVAGSKGEQSRLSLFGRGFLVRPRRLGGVCSIHEVGAISGREGLRAAMLWQLGDILLGKSLWRHHSLHSYIHGLDRVQLRIVEIDNDIVQPSENSV